MKSTLVAIAASAFAGVLHLLTYHDVRKADMCMV
jgi:hypothetical protein